jgi:threonyl-tRNA synthetase
MAELARRDLPVQREVWQRDEAVAFFKSIGEHYKAELIDAIPQGQEVSLYREGDFVDLCRGPHVPSTGKLKVFKLMKLAGAYWRGDHRNEQLQRIYGTAWARKEDQEAYLHMLEEAEKRDHRKLGRQLDLFHLQDEAPGMVFWHAKGWTIWQEVEQYLRRVLEPQRLLRSEDADDHGSYALGALRPLAELCRAHVHHGVREPRLRDQADELPWPHPDLQPGPAQLP